MFPTGVCSKLSQFPVTYSEWKLFYWMRSTLAILAWATDGQRFKPQISCSSSLVWLHCCHKKIGLILFCPRQGCSEYCLKCIWLYWMEWKVEASWNWWAKYVLREKEMLIFAFHKTLGKFVLFWYWQIDRFYVIIYIMYIIYIIM